MLCSIKLLILSRRKNLEIFDSIAFGRESLSISESQEWLVTNGIGGYASGTVAGLLTRRYHGLLVAALDPPLGRTLLGVKLEEIATYGGKEYALSANRWESQSVSPEGYQFIEQFKLEGEVPIWTFAFGDAVLEKRIWMEKGANTTYVLFQLKKASHPVDFSFKAMTNYRGFHNSTHAGNWRQEIEMQPKGLKVNAFPGAVPFYILSDRAKASVTNEWYYNYFLSEEQERGLDCTEDHLHAGTFVATLKQGQSVTFVFTTEANSDLDGKKIEERRGQNPFWIEQLMLASNAFIVDRNMGKTIIAGYHWFGDWGRDTMISLPGLTLTTGRAQVAKSILQTFAKFIDQGMLPNRFPDAGQKPEYNTADATLWYFEAIRAYYDSTKDLTLIKELFPILSDIVNWHQKGTRYQIKVDPKDGLLHAGENGVQLTWMDAKIGDWVVTPRIGKPIEINALWYNALKTMGDFARQLGVSSVLFDQAAEKAVKGFQRFWNGHLGFCYDVIDGPGGDDPTLRPNQIFAVSLEHTPLSIDQNKAIVSILENHLLTPRGLRSLDPSDSRYCGRYSGSPSQRDSVYHQGPVWGWLLGPFSLAHFKVFKDQQAALKFLEPMADHLKEAGLGTCSEIFDGDAPFAPKGCIAQAWTVAEILRAWFLIS